MNTFYSPLGRPQTMIPPLRFESLSIMNLTGVREAHFNFLLNLASTSTNLKVLQALSRFPRAAIARQASQNRAPQDLAVPKTLSHDQKIESRPLLDQDLWVSDVVWAYPGAHRIKHSAAQSLHAHPITWHSGELENLLLNNDPARGPDCKPPEAWLKLAQYVEGAYSSLVLRVGQLNLETLLELRAISGVSLLLAVHPQISTNQLETLWNSSLDYTVCRLVSLHPHTSAAIEQKMALEARNNW